MSVHNTTRRVLAATSCAALAASLVVAATVPATASSDVPLPDKSDLPQPVAQEARASGLVITYDTGVAAASQTGVQRAVAASGLTLAKGSVPIQGTTVAHAFTETVPLAQANEAAKAVAQLPGVATAEPDTVVQAFDAPPVTVSDPYLKSDQWNIWDWRDGSVGGIPLPAGGYSTHAPSLWEKTKGTYKVVVAVLDTGRTAHAQLDKSTVAGYDMISKSFVARDGNGRDANPQDQGDWSSTEDSSWHGTHVAGIIAARADKVEGVGNAPGVRVQHVRVLGAGGGSMSDVAAGIIWASGGTVTGVPKNATPARVINLSLGGRGTCDSTTQSAINSARSRGAVVVVAAGNDDQPASAYTPASCAGVITVAALDEYGQRASYSNYGAAVEIGAPGGEYDGTADYRPIASTWNTGTTTPGSPAWGLMMGTSQAAPGVSGGAALIASLGLSGASVEKAVKAAYSPYPKYASGTTWNCGGTCGKGWFDLRKILAPLAPARITGTAKVGTYLKVTLPEFTGRVASRPVQWLVNGKPVSGATSTIYKVKAADRGKYIQVRVTARSTGSFYAVPTTSAKTAKVV